MNAFCRVRLVTVVIVALALSVEGCSPQESKLGISRADSETSIRFFFNPGTYFHEPLIFRAVRSDDVRINTVSHTGPGREVYISLEEMDRFINALSSSTLKWQNSRQKIPFVVSIQIPLRYEMSIDVLYSGGSAASAIDPKKICSVLPAMDPAFISDRPRWEFQMFRLGYDCPIPQGLNTTAYPYNYWDKHN
jgi:hypothetical protein